MKRNSLTLGIMMAIGAVTATQALAADEGQKEERIEVVGSHIKRTDAEGPSPVLTVTREDIDKSGYSNLQQLLEKIPAAGNGTFSTRGNNQDSTANGAASISLRGFGADATLVLVNGRRVAISAFAEGITTNFVDINSIPVAAIERVEVLKDGASALYGSDAVAGVINIVLRKDYEGSEVTLGYGNTTDSDNDEKTVSAMWGVGGEDSNMTLIFDYFKNSALLNKDRGHLGTANQTAWGGEDFRSSRGFPGRFIVDGVATRDPNCPAASIPSDITNPTCLYDYGPWNVLTPAAERTGLMLLGRRNLGDSVELFTEIGVQHNTSEAQGAPTPLDGDAGLTVPADHPNNPFTGASEILINRLRTVDAGGRRFDVESDSLRMVLGLQGSLGEWDWEMSAQRARSESMQTGSRSQGWIRTDFLQTEINAGRYNPFGGTYNPQSVLDAIATSVVRNGSSSLTSYEGEISGELFDMAGGAAAMAVGLEYREERAVDTPDDQFQRGLIFGTESVSAAASRDHSSAFVEFSLPLHDTLELQLAGRFDDYSDFGTTTNPKVAMRWAPIDSMAIRASWGTGFRAPSLAQIGLGPSQESLFFVDTFGCAQIGTPQYCTNTDYTVVFGGNPDLEAEESETMNVGVALQATETLSFTYDYWDISQENKIDKVSLGDIVNNEDICNDQSSTVCRRGTPLSGQALGELSQVYSGFINIGEQSAKGIDFGVHYADELMGGKFRAGMDYSYLIEFKRVEANGSGGLVSRALTGEYEYPEHRAVLTADWSNDNWGYHASWNYTGAFEDTPDADFDGALDYDTHSSRDVAAFQTLNLQMRYMGMKDTIFTFGADNALDEEPPFATGDGDADVYGYVSSQHSPRGQFVYGKVTYSF